MKLWLVGNYVMSNNSQRNQNFILDNGYELIVTLGVPLIFDKSNNKVIVE